MMTRKKANGWLWVLALFAVCTVVYGLLSSYPRELAVYSDELRYLDVARSLWQGRGLRVRNMPSDYQKILYPLCILPALALKTTAAQITAIGWLNAAWASSATRPTLRTPWRPSAGCAPCRGWRWRASSPTSPCPTRARPPAGHTPSSSTAALRR